MKPLHVFVGLFLLLASQAVGRTVTIRNDQPRRAVDGSYVDAHDGKIVYHNGTYYLYGEAYGNQTLATKYPWPNVPRLRVYTSPDLVSWTDQGDPLPMVPGTLWIPNVLYDAPNRRFVLWYGSGVWGTATSEDGIHFTPAGSLFASRLGPKAGTDGTGVFVDDDGVGYVVFAASPPNMDSPTHRGWPGHIAHNFGHLVSIERMTPDLLGTTRTNVSDFFPDDFVESPSLFKHNGRYYVTYGSCCCGCSEGTGQVVFSAPSIHGPWTRQVPHADVNCRNVSAQICGAFSLRSDNRENLVFNAQWWGPSFIPLADGTTQVLYLGRRWLSGANAPVGCRDICGNGGNPAACQSGGEHYLLKSDLSVWYPLEFDETTGAIQPMQPRSSFTLQIL